MKMKVGTRIIFSIYIIIVLLLCLFMLATMVGWMNPSMLGQAVATMQNGALAYKFLYGAIFVVLIIVGIALLFFGTRKETPKTAKIAEFESGSAVITIKAIEDLVERYVREQDEVKGTDIKVLSNTDSIDVAVNLEVLPNTNIPEVTKKLQDGLVESLQQQTGIKVNNSKIMIVGLNDTAKPARVE